MHLYRGRGQGVRGNEGVGGSFPGIEPEISTQFCDLKKYRKITDTDKSSCISYFAFKWALPYVLYQCIDTLQDCFIGLLPLTIFFPCVKIPLYPFYLHSPLFLDQLMFRQLQLSRLIVLHFLFQMANIAFVVKGSSVRQDKKRCIFFVLFFSAVIKKFK